MNEEPTPRSARPARLTLPIPPGEDRRAAGLRTLAEIEADLSRPLDPGLLHTKPKAGQNLIYVEHTTVKRLLDNYAYGWRVRQTFHLSAQGRIICDLLLLVPTSDQGLVERANVGSDADDSDDQELNPETGELLPVGYTWHTKFKKVIKKPEQVDPAMVAWAAAFKRAAAFGFGLSLYLYYLDKASRAKLEALIPDENKTRGRD